MSLQNWITGLKMDYLEYKYKYYLVIIYQIYLNN